MLRLRVEIIAGVQFLIIYIHSIFIHSSVIHHVSNYRSM